MDTSRSSFLSATITTSARIATRLDCSEKFRKSLAQLMLRELADSVPMLRVKAFGSVRLMELIGMSLQTRILGCRANLIELS